MNAVMPVLHYIYDALCGWCYGFTPVVRKLYEASKDRIAFEVLSGGMIPPEFARPIGAKADFIARSYKTVEEYTGVKFGEAYLRHIFHPEQSAWVEESLTPAVALCLLKAAQPYPLPGGIGGAVYFASAIQQAHMAEGKDLSDPGTYRSMAEAVGCDWDDFKKKLASEEWRESAQYEFALVKQLGITSFPAMVVQVSEDRFYLIARGYTPYEEVAHRLDQVLAESAGRRPS
jgi:putative protein-disulfide isomerase